MIDDDQWWSTTVNDDRWWSMMIDDDRQWLMMIDNDWKWLTMIYDNWRWSMMIDNDWWWSKTRLMTWLFPAILMHVEEVSQNMYCILSVIEYIIREVSQNIPIYTYSATLAYNGISIKIYLKTTCFRVYIQRHLVLKYINRHFLYMCRCRVHPW